VITTWPDTGTHSISTSCCQEISLELNSKTSVDGQAELAERQNVERLHHRQTMSNTAAAAASVYFHYFSTRYICFN
jgi:hypothetical protein